MTHGRYVDGVLACVIEQYTVIATAQTKSCEWGLEFLHITGKVTKIAVDAVRICIAASRSIARNSA